MTLRHIVQGVQVRMTIAYMREIVRHITEKKCYDVTDSERSSEHSLSTTGIVVL